MTALETPGRSPETGREAYTQKEWMGDEQDRERTPEDARARH
jgi:hypothetical protein